MSLNVVKTMDIFRISYVIVTSKLLLNSVTGTNFYVQEGSNTTLLCELRIQKIFWTGPPDDCVLSDKTAISPYCENHERLTVTGSSINEYNLHIENVQYADIGRYTCYGVINMTIPTQISFLYLKVPLTIVSFTPDGEVTVRPNDTEEFVCSARAVPHPNITWFIGGNTITATNETRINDTVTSVLHYIGKIKDNGNDIYCGAESGGISQNSSLTRLNITYGPTNSIVFNQSSPSAVKVEGERLDAIACSATCNPMCQYRWTKERDLVEEGKILFKQSLVKEDDGVYTCTAWNAFGESTKDFIVTVNYGPSSVVLLPNRTYYSEKENMTIPVINCTSSCRPPCTMIWMGPNGEIGNSPILTLQKINRTDAGNYKCNASNSVSSMVSVAVNVTVTYGPGNSITLNLTTNSLTKETGDQLNPIVCTAKCIPNCQYEWIKPGNIAQQGNTLFVPVLTKDDHGDYRCRAWNDFGNRTIGFNLTVNYGPQKVNLSQHNTSYVIEENGSLEKIHCMSSCRPMCEVKWIGPNGQMRTSNVLNLKAITRKEAGVYICNASNIVGSMVSSNITVVVTYAAVVKQLTLNNGNNFTVMENANVILNCTIDGIPQPRISWSFDGKEIKENENKTLYVFPKVASCTNTGNYTCEALNDLGRSINTEELFVICKSRYDFRKPILSNNIGVKDDEGLNITVFLIGYPRPTIHWTFNNSSMDKLVQNSFDTFNQVSILYRQKMTNKDFGVYSMTAFNNVGKIYSRDFIVESQRRPDLPDNISVFCEKTSITVAWKSNFNGGDPQVFRVLLQNWKTNNTIYSENMSDPGEDLYRNATTHSLLPSTLYLVFVQAINNHGVVKSEEHTNCSTDTDPIVSSASSSTAIIGGIAGSVCALAVICVITIIYWVHRKRIKDKDKELIERCSKKPDENDDDELKDNPLYVTSDDACNSQETAVYSTVKKNQPAVYSTIQKTSKAGHNGKHVKGAKGSGKKSVTKSKEIELGSVYENSDKLLKRGTNDEIYANAEKKEQRCHQSEESNNPIKNKDGLIYADLDLLPGPGGKKFVIRGIENRNNYAVIDLSKTAEPLPSDDEEEEDNANKENKKGDAVE